jgi:hypothetical protein
MLLCCSSCMRDIKIPFSRDEACTRHVSLSADSARQPWTKFPNMGRLRWRRSAVSSVLVVEVTSGVAFAVVIAVVIAVVTGVVIVVIITFQFLEDSLDRAVLIPAKTPQVTPLEYVSQTLGGCGRDRAHQHPVTTV